MKSPTQRKSARIRIIGAASGIGAQDQACKDGPVAFHHSQAWHELAHHSQVDWGRTLFAPDDDGEPDRRADRRTVPASGRRGGA
jgi:arginase